MKQIALVLMALLPAFGAHGQTVSNITSQYCNVALNQCTLTDNSSDTVTLQGQWVYSGTVTMNVATPTGPQPSRSCLANRTLVSQTLYKIVEDLVLNCNDGASLSGTYTSTRSGSGRGGWAWHPHVSFDTLTLY